MTSLLRKEFTVMLIRLYYAALTLIWRIWGLPRSLRIPLRKRHRRVLAEQLSRDRLSRNMCRLMSRRRPSWCSRPAPRALPWSNTRLLRPIRSTRPRYSRTTRQLSLPLPTGPDCSPITPFRPPTTPFRLPVVLSRPRTTSCRPHMTPFRLIIYPRPNLSPRIRPPNARKGRGRILSSAASSAGTRPNRQRCQHLSALQPSRNPTDPESASRRIRSSRTGQVGRPAGQSHRLSARLRRSRLRRPRAGTRGRLRRRRSSKVHPPPLPAARPPPRLSRTGERRTGFTRRRSGTGRPLLPSEGHLALPLQLHRKIWTARRRRKRAPTPPPPSWNRMKRNKERRGCARSRRASRNLPGTKVTQCSERTTSSSLAPRPSRWTLNLSYASEGAYKGGGAVLTPCSQIVVHY